MYSTLKFKKNSYGTYDLLVIYNNNTKFGLDFFSNTVYEKSKKSINDFIEKNRDDKRIANILLVISGLIAAKIPYSEFAREDEQKQEKKLDDIENLQKNEIDFPKKLVLEAKKENVVSEKLMTHDIVQTKTPDKFLPNQIKKVITDNINDEKFAHNKAQKQIHMNAQMKKIPADYASDYMNIKSGETVLVLGVFGDFTKIIYKNKVGYVKSIAL